MALDVRSKRIYDPPDDGDAIAHPAPGCARGSITQPDILGDVAMDVRSRRTRRSV
jgi:hypothetical protein